LDVLAFRLSGTSGGIQHSDSKGVYFAFGLSGAGLVGVHPEATGRDSTMLYTATMSKPAKTARLPDPAVTAFEFMQRFVARSEGQAEAKPPAKTKKPKKKPAK
jgi:hypothetical protein